LPDAESFSITTLGRVPIAVGAGSPAVPSFVTPSPGDAICVMVRFEKALLVGAHEGVQPARNSVTVPRTSTRSPTTTAFETTEPKTSSASDVAGSASGVSSWIHVFEPRSAITTPSTFTSWPVNGDMCPAPCTWPICVTPSVVVKVNEWSAAIVSGGSIRSTSWTPASSIVTVQLSFEAKSASGSSVYVVGPPVTVAVCRPDVLHEIVCHGSTTVTGSLNVTVMLLSPATSLAPFAGLVLDTEGALSATTSQKCRKDNEFRGAGVAALKSAPLLSVSVQPPFARNAAVVFESVGAAAGPSKKLALP
jgi:hypothetical protein